ncbi:MAG TPA: lipid A biosynthesis acyltransferase [Parafilimonas sp.]|nr:lipid A biosynthesis acyltransferase [Parafilimonas sp.]
MYYLAYGFLYLVSLLPFFIIYLISDFFYFLIYHVWGYRKDVVLNNLAIAFPDKSFEERKQISKQFYKNLVDNFIETIKLISISKKQLQRRFTFNIELPNEQYNSGRNVQFHLGHFFNWEYANLALSIASKYPVLVVYMPVVNKTIDKLFLKIRTRFNAKMIAATYYRRDFSPYSKGRYAIVFVADQNPGVTDNAYWSNFFNKPTPFVTGPEKNAKLNNCIVYYARFSKPKRGFYNLEFILLTDNPRSLKEGELTKKMIRELETSVKENPAIYLWSHRRWKHEFKPERHERLMI